MSEVQFKADDKFASELLCDKCDNQAECDFDGTDDDKACSIYKYLEANME